MLDHRAPIHTHITFSCTFASNKLINIRQLIFHLYVSASYDDGLMEHIWVMTTVQRNLRQALRMQKFYTIQRNVMLLEIGNPCV